MPSESLATEPTGRGDKPELVVLTNTPTPYRIPFFNALHESLQAHGAALRVFYCALREPHRHWELRLDEQAYPWQVLAGWHPSVGGWHPHLNPSVVPELRRARPRWILSAGAWNLPTVLLAAHHLLTGTTYRIFWSEGHEKSVLHPSGLIAAVRRRALRAYDAVAVPNEASARFVRSETGEQTRVLLLPNTVDDEFFRQPTQAERTTARKYFGVTEDRAVILSVAQLEDRKGILELLSGYERLPDQLRVNTVLVLVGEGSFRSVLETRARALASGEVRVVGHLDESGVREWLWAADVFALATKLDPNPLSVIEAAFCGLPLIVSRQAGNVGELVQDVNGMVLERIDPEHVTAVLQRFLMRRRETWRAMGERSMGIADVGFRRRNVARHFVEELMAGSGSG